MGTLHSRHQEVCTSRGSNSWRWDTIKSKSECVYVQKCVFGVMLLWFISKILYQQIYLICKLTTSLTGFIYFVSSSFYRQWCCSPKTWASLLPVSKWSSAQLFLSPACCTQTSSSVLSLEMVWANYYSIHGSPPALLTYWLRHFGSF